MRRTRTRTVVIAATVAGLAAAGAIVAVLVSGDSDIDPNQDKVTSLCHDAAKAEPAMTEGVNAFTVDELTHETDGADTFFRASGTATTSDGFGGTRSYTFDCQTKLAGGNRWELIDIAMI